MVKTSMLAAKNLKGFSLIELMVAVAILGILLAIAVPLYTDYVTKARRAEAQSDMLQIRLAMEKWRANNSSYLSTLDHSDDATNLTPADLADNLSTANTYYNYALQLNAAGGAPDGSRFHIKATPQGTQASRDTGCNPLGLDQSGSKTPATGCWKK